MAFTSGSPSAGQLEIGIALVLQDRFSNQAREASSVIRGLHPVSYTHLTLPTTERV